MNTKGNIDQQVEETLESVSKIDSVQTSPFFKEKLMRRLAEQETAPTEGVAYLTWFTPK